MTNESSSKGGEEGKIPFIESVPQLFPRAVLLAKHEALKDSEGLVDRDSLLSAASSVVGSAKAEYALERGLKEGVFIQPVEGKIKKE